MCRGRLLAAIGSLAALPSCSLLLDFSGSISDAGVVDAATNDATDTCSLDEPNDAIDMLTPAVTGPVASSICPEGDHDFYGFTVDGITDVVIVLRFDEAGGANDLQLALYDLPSGIVRTVSNGTDDSEKIEHSAALANVLPAGDYAIEVYGQGDAVRTSYQLELELGDGGGLPDAGIPDAAPI